MIMKNKTLVILLVILFSLLLFYVVFHRNFTKEGFNIDNINTFYDQHGDSAQITKGPDGTWLITTTPSSGTGIVYSSSAITSTTSLSSLKGTTFTSPSGGSAVIMDSNGQYAIQITENGTTTLYTNSLATMPTTSTATATNSVSTPSMSTTPATSTFNFPTNAFYAQNGSTLTIESIGGSYAIVVTNVDGTTSSYYINPNVQSVSGASFSGPNGTAVVLSRNNQYSVIITQPNGQITVYTPMQPNSTQQQPYTTQQQPYTTQQQPMYPYPTQPYPTQPYPTQPTQSYPTQSYPTQQPYSQQINGYAGSSGIPASQIPQGQENLYILKSEIVPSSTSSTSFSPYSQNSNNINDSANSTTSSSCASKAQDVPPCPACARCPSEPYKCKLVPDYNAIQQQDLPVPVLNSFSGFGM